MPFLSLCCRVQVVFSRGGVKTSAEIVHLRDSHNRLDISAVKSGTDIAGA
eukprot:m.12216 g.12216  ORF g.12216 m.12216 type:complete len:50 (-) comp9530_c0_seq1:156-305(-)